MTLLKSSSVLNLLISMTKPQRFAFNASGPGSNSEASAASRLRLFTAVAAPSPNIVETPAIFRNCLLSILINCSPSVRYDNPSSKASQPYSYGRCRKTLFCSNGNACKYFGGSCCTVFRRDLHKPCCHRELPHPSSCSAAAYARPSYTPW